MQHNVLYHSLKPLGFDYHIGMSVNPDGMDTVDYSDFEYQQTTFAVEHDENNFTSGSVASQVQQEIGVLESIGGLDNNEVAELVYVEVDATIRHDLAGPDQDVGSETILRFAFGANFPVGTQFLPRSNSQQGPSQTINSVGGINEAGVIEEGSDVSEDRIFVRGEMNKVPAFDDVDGPGGGAGSAPYVKERDYRNTTGRGPVLDRSDDLTVQIGFQQDDEVIGATATIDVHMIWDVAETSDAGRRFSLPN